MLFLQEISKGEDACIVADIELAEFERRFASILNEDFGCFELRVVAQSLDGFGSSFSGACSEVDEEWA